jgi:hypothetical protein
MALQLMAASPTDRGKAAQHPAVSEGSWGEVGYPTWALPQMSRGWATGGRMGKRCLNFLSVLPAGAAS